MFAISALLMVKLHICLPIANRVLVLFSSCALHGAVVCGDWGRDFVGIGWRRVQVFSAPTCPGDVVFYPSLTVHKVNVLQSGEREALIWWIPPLHADGERIELDDD